MAQYELSGECSLTGTVTLTVYDGDSTYHTYTDKVSKGLFFFEGEVEGPVLASLTHPAMARPLYFYLENSDLRIVINASKPEMSQIKGSRSNSEYRYLMERYRSQSDPTAFLKQSVRENASSIYLPYVLHSQMSSLDEGVLRQLVGQLTGAACHTYHYTLLRRWLRQTPAVSEGVEMPDFAYLDAQKQRRLFAETRNQEGYTLLFFGANWCDICKKQQQQAETFLANKPAEVLSIQIDDNPNGWNAQYLKQLNVDHLPYMILVDKDGVVVRRDLRIWEISQLHWRK